MKLLVWTRHTLLLEDLAAYLIWKCFEKNFEVYTQEALVTREFLKSLSWLCLSLYTLWESIVVNIGNVWDHDLCVTFFACVDVLYCQLPFPKYIWLVTHDWNIGLIELMCVE